VSGVPRAPGVETLFPPGVVAHEIHGGTSPDGLFPAERECVARAVEKRVREFSAGRLCARAGLIALGFEPQPLLVGQDRAPVWPSGVVGSITHTDGYCVAVVGLEERFASLGVDAERVGQVDPSLWRLTMRAEEIGRLESLDDTVQKRMATVIFSAKEAFYKCQYGLTRQWLGFESVRVEAGDEAFEVAVLDEAHPSYRREAPWRGRFSVDDALVVTGIASAKRI
jgi:4'-phosphopantetheinyl transferase EntD